MRSFRWADKINTKVQRLCFFTAVNSSGELLYCYDRSWHLISYHVIWDWSSVPFKRFKTGTDTRSWHCLKLCIMSKIFQGEGAKNVFLAYNVYLASKPSNSAPPPPCFRIGGAEDNFINYIEYCFFFVPVMKLRWEYNILKQFQSISCLMFD